MPGSLYLVKMTVDAPPSVALKEWSQWSAEAHEAEARTWHHDMLPHHFESSAHFVYGYRPRSKKYRDRKKRLYQVGVAQLPDRDLVFTGNLKKHVLEFVSIRATAQKAVAQMTAPFYVAVRPKIRSGPNKPEELTTVIESEVRELSEGLNDYMTAKLNSLHEPKEYV